MFVVSKITFGVDGSLWLNIKCLLMFDLDVFLHLYLMSIDIEICRQNVTITFALSLSLFLSLSPFRSWRLQANSSFSPRIPSPLQANGRSCWLRRWCVRCVRCVLRGRMCISLTHCWKRLGICTPQKIYRLVRIHILLVILSLDFLNEKPTSFSSSL